MRLRGSLQKPLINQHMFGWFGLECPLNHTWHSDTSPWFNLFKNEFYLFRTGRGRHLILEPVAGIYNYSEDAILKIQELTQKSLILFNGYVADVLITFTNKEGYKVMLPYKM
ncbi:MAG: hypothetical protein U0401_31410 [Anaerolineae bacterium]